MLTAISSILFISGITGSIVMKKQRTKNLQQSITNSVEITSTEQGDNYRQTLSSTEENTKKNLETNQPETIHKIL